MLCNNSLRVPSVNVAATVIRRGFQILDCFGSLCVSFPFSPAKAGCLMSVRHTMISWVRCRRLARQRRLTHGVIVGTGNIPGRFSRGNLTCGVVGISRGTGSVRRSGLLDGALHHGRGGVVMHLVEVARGEETLEGGWGWWCTCIAIVVMVLPFLLY